VYQFGWTPHGAGLLRARRERPRSRGSTEKRDELATFQLVEVHSISASQGRIAGYRTGRE
jgi:hypothetical protein